MHAEDLTLDDGCQRQVIEGIIEIVPDIVIAVLFGCLLIKAVDIGDVAGLVVTTQQHDVLRVFYLVQK